MAQVLTIASEAARPAATLEGRARAWWNLLRFLVGARLKLWTQDRWLGVWWWLLEPLAMTGTYVLVVKGAFRSGPPNYGLFVMCAMLPWTWFTAACGLGGVSLVANVRLLKSFRVSYAVFPTAEVAATGVRFLMSLLILGMLLVFYRIPVTWQLLWLPLLAAVQLVFTLGVCYWLSLAQVYAVDTQNLWQIVTRVWFFLSPSIYALDQVPEWIRGWYLLNPFAALFCSYRDVVIEGRPPELAHLGTAAVLGVVLAVSGLAVMRRLEGVLPLRM